MTTDAVPAVLTALLDALHHHDARSAATYLADDIVLRSPIFADPFHGREKAAAVIAHLLDAVDDFQATEILGNDRSFAVLLQLRVGDAEVEGVDVVHLNDEGKVDSMTVQWRPLPAIVAVQNRLAPAVGVPALTLIEKQ
ncbi:nuclear transport factor 2 family protein [Mycobacterium sp. 236(2023)]|uniref:nuclear transport factor 2 family protein n=1 Tax=Mycobacterium sp. 236(2023) TaxID=3038163 RepID=UPI00241586E4|nr:nuclear transport factor 2 family protein [Mycobacterium sp. 236(2023)]MDG4667445.1 nuclear transport factor 2 family protein [Mycobacterium sp. 236(2023)]